MILVDSNVAIDVLNDESEHHSWSRDRLAEAVEHGGFVNHIVVAELSVRLNAPRELERLLQLLGLPVDPMDNDVAFQAGQAFARWIESGGRRGALLPDLLIGAHAVARRARILTRDPRRFRRYFPKVELITPESEI